MKNFIYNTQQNDLILKEYGRNVQKLVDHIITIEDRDKRNKYAQILVELMRQIHPNMRDNQDYSNKLWDDLYILSQFNLEVDAPYPMPEKDALGKKPKMVAYNTHELHYKHYGRNVELLIEKAIAMENPDDRFNAIIYIGRLMKSFYGTWNKENVDDAVIVEHLREMSENKLNISLEKVKAENLFDASAKEKSDNRNKVFNNPNAKKMGNNPNMNNNRNKQDNKQKRKNQ
ncbi:DUF4290 domain-containing protein [Rhodocytophaga rosea]|uniref:DUF4290 domain-containing protein n=1 Tax=Rhodocytophaga rosea TaxID=2704465 RepID=A0A6C0GP38_9BACT|nr:DUF4290 domain-containing protein [Rhodocytophaga rosea]QHT69795.1 DUF4290 domain-containing protein [Rhodocytophaga rosea]